MTSSRAADAVPEPAPPSAPVPQEGRRPASEAERKALASVVRLRILRLCRYEELTNLQLAQRLGRNPATVLHHVRTLVDTGFLVAGEPRRGTRGSREVPYRATGLSWRLDGLDEPGGASTMLRAFLEEVARVPPEQVETIRMGLRLPPAEIEEFRRRLAGLLDEFARRPVAADGEQVSVFTAVHPDPS